ncbi:uncharacterized protein MEPE_04628 [Melanopsichium pennsylvanicum]|uniref:Uncharacterized protein n=1 Tax=Melanopsichium pennsylvanicum TaxID=63383 RepID=A0AAJ5C6X3_9BASI|nr:uncharacterized protein MEPE_04628 [Melanopsichium pennsylvanicum]
MHAQYNVSLISKTERRLTFFWKSLQPSEEHRFLPVADSRYRKQNVARGAADEAYPFCYPSTTMHIATQGGCSVALKAVSHSEEVVRTQSRKNITQCLIRAWLRGSRRPDGQLSSQREVFDRAKNIAVMIEMFPSHKATTRKLE